jgi:hypothetical protein
MRVTDHEELGEEFGPDLPEYSKTPYQGPTCCSVPEHHQADSLLSPTGHGPKFAAGPA